LAVNYFDAEPRSGHRDQRIVGEPAASNSLIVILERQPRQDFTCFYPVTEIGDRYLFCLSKTAFHLRHIPTISQPRSSIEFFKHNCTQPHDRASSDPFETESGVFASQGGNIN